MNVAEPNEIKAMNRRERRELARHLADVKAVWSTAEGRRLLWKIMADAGFMRTSMTGNSWTFFNEGARNIAIAMFSDVQQASPEMFLLAMNEAKKSTKREEEEDLAVSEPPEKEQENG